MFFAIKSEFWDDLLVVILCLAAAVFIPPSHSVWGPLEREITEDSMMLFLTLRYLAINKNEKKNRIILFNNKKIDNVILICAGSGIILLAIGFFRDPPILISLGFILFAIYGILSILSRMLVGKAG